MKKQFGKTGLISLIFISLFSCNKQEHTFKPSVVRNNDVFKVEEVKIEKVKKEEEIPDIDEFIEYEQEPTVDFSKLRANVDYPKVAIRKRIEGKVIISVYVDKYGKAKKTVIEKSTSSVFDEAAIESVKRTTFTPGINKGQTVAGWITIPIVFKLK